MCKPDRANSLDKYYRFHQSSPIICIECQLCPSISIYAHHDQTAIHQSFKSRSHRIHLEHGIQEVLDNDAPVLLARLLDHHNLLVGLLVGLLLGGLVALAML